MRRREGSFIFLVCRAFLPSCLVFVTLSSYSVSVSKSGGSADAIVWHLSAIDRLPLFTSTTYSDTIKAKPDLYYECKLAGIGSHSPIDFDYNPYVKRYIDIYTLERRDQVSKMIGLSEMYFPIFEEIFAKYQLPLELKYLAVVESALNPLAVSKSGAVGLWQFKINTAKMFNLVVNNFVDERMDPIKSTEAAAQYLDYLFRTFKDWHLALAAYNVGPGPIRNAIERANGERNFWKLYPLLPESAQNYVPAFIAAAYVMNSFAEHGIFPTPLKITFSKTDTVLVPKPLDLNLVAEALDLDLEIIRFLNPTYRYDYIPESSDYQVLRLPNDKTGLFIRKSKQLYVNTRKPNGLPKPSADSSQVRLSYTVQNGDSLHKLAMHFGCTLNDIYRWNPGIDSTLTVGQSLIFWISKSNADKYSIKQ